VSRATWVIRICKKILSFTPPVRANVTQTSEGEIILTSTLDFEDGRSRNKIPPDSNAGFLPPPLGSTSTSSKRFLWSLSFYSQFFDVDTNEVVRRCYAAIFPRANFLDVLEGNPDLYGPFWIATTVVMILFLTGTISHYLSRKGEGHFEYDFTLLSGAAGLVYGYTGVIPIALWGVLKWFGSESANLLECWALYGYANLIWIPVALISWSPITILNWVFVGAGFGISALFLFRNLYPVLSATDVKTSKVLLILVVGLHAGLAIAIKILFFAYVRHAAIALDRDLLTSLRHGSPVSKKNKVDGTEEGLGSVLLGL